MMHTLLRISALAAASYAALSVSFPVQARACSFAFLEHFVDADEAAVDTTPPAAPVIGEVMFHRRPDRSERGCRQSASSCDGTGTIGISIDMAADDRTAEADMGYVIEIAGGALPSEVYLPMEAVRADESGILWFWFGDHDQDLDFTVSVRARDLGGNLGEPVEVQVIDSSQGGDGCSAGASAGPSTLALVMLALAASLRRRRDPFPG